MLRCVVTLLVSIHVLLLCVPRADADARARLEALLERSGIHASTGLDATPEAPVMRGRTGALTDTGDSGDTLFCLNFTKRDTRKMLGVRKGHAYVCFNFLQNPSEAVGNVLNRRGQQQCLITGFFDEGPTLEQDCLILALCGQIYVAGSCF